MLHSFPILHDSVLHRVGSLKHRTVLRALITHLHTTKHTHGRKGQLRECSGRAAAERGHSSWRAAVRSDCERCFSRRQRSMASQLLHEAARCHRIAPLAMQLRACGAPVSWLRRGKSRRAGGAEQENCERQVAGIAVLYTNHDVLQFHVLELLLQCSAGACKARSVSRLSDRRLLIRVCCRC